jgi:hypothetical protein
VAYHRLGVELLRASGWAADINDIRTLGVQGRKLEQLASRLCGNCELNEQDKAFLKHRSLNRYDDWKGEVMRAFESARMNCRGTCRSIDTKERRSALPAEAITAVYRRCC